MQVELNNGTKKLAVIGDPISHTLSPLIHNTALRELGLNYVYLCQYVPRGGAAAWLAAAKVAGYAGFNATMPHKVELVPLMDELDGDAAAFGSVNTVCIRDGRCLGYNTDGKGFLQSLRELGADPAGRRVALLGTGGAAKAVALSLARAGAARVTVCNRTAAKAEALCAEAPEKLRPSGFSPRALRDACAGAELLVNCTSLGMTGVPGQFADFAFLDALAPGAAVCDLIYSPPETRLLAEARARGFQTENGLAMLIWQALYALEYFTGTTFDGRTLAARLRPLLLAQSGG